MTNKVQAALELRRALQLYLADLDPETEVEKIVSVPTMFPTYKVGAAYKTKQVFQYGENGVGDPQLYQVLQDHTSAAEWRPDTSASLYKKIGVTEDGTAQWVQPLGASDAYMQGDVVFHRDKKWSSDADYNVWEPGVHGWTEQA